MLSTDVRQELMIKRIEQAVSILMTESPFFKEEFDYSEMVKHLFDLAQENLTNKQFNDLPDEELKEICSFIMATEILSKIGKDFTPEQMAIFEGSIKRK